MVVEAAAFAGDLETVFDLLPQSTDAGLFDLHWLENCPPLEPVRRDARYPAMHAQIKARAEAILDALPGETGSVADAGHGPATS